MSGDAEAVRRVVDGIDDAVDRKHWAACRALFADDLVGAWRANLPAGKPSFHLRTNHAVEVEGDRATCVSKGHALNLLPRPGGSGEWEVFGWYTHTLVRTPDGWRCTGIALEVVHARGNEAVRTGLPGA